MEEGPIRLTDPPPQTGPSAADEADAEIEWVDEVQESAPRPPLAEVEIDFEPEVVAKVDTPQEPSTANEAASPARPHRPSRTAGQRATRHAARPAAKVPTRPMIEVAVRPTLGEWVKAHRNRLIFLAVALLVVGTVAYRYRMNRQRELPLVAEIGKIEGLPALDAGDFDTAHRKLAAAKRAVEALGGAYEGTDDLVQGANEAAIFVDLLNHSLEDIVSEAARSENERDWQQRFNDLYKGRSILLDGNAADYRILSRSGIKNNRVGRIDTTDFRLLNSVKPQPGENNFVFGARLASVTLKDGQWRVGLEPESGVIITHQKALDSFGWPTESNKAASENPR